MARQCTLDVLIIQATWFLENYSQACIAVTSHMMAMNFRLNVVKCSSIATILGLPALMEMYHQMLLQEDTQQVESLYMLVVQRTMELLLQEKFIHHIDVCTCHLRGRNIAIHAMRFLLGNNIIVALQFSPQFVLRFIHLPDHHAIVIIDHLIVIRLVTVLRCNLLFVLRYNRLFALQLGPQFVPQSDIQADLVHQSISIMDISIENVKTFSNYAFYQLSSN